MPVINIEENIKEIYKKMREMSIELHRLEGVVKTFEGFKRGGLTTIDLPNDSNHDNNQPELESLQENPE